MRRGRRGVLVVVVGVLALLAGCTDGMETRTFEVRYLPPHVVSDLIGPYVFAENAGMSVTEGAVTVRESPANLDQIGRVLETFDRPRPTVTLHFQIILANGGAETDPAIADVERELRRLFRFQGYDLVAETQVSAIQGSLQRQVVGEDLRDAGFIISSGVTEVRPADAGTTVTLDVELRAGGVGEVLSTSVTIPAGHSVVLGTANAPSYEGALILVVRAEVQETTVTQDTT